MSLQRIVGIFVLAGGVILIVLGVLASRTLGSHISSFFTGQPSNAALWYLIGGVVAAIAGFVLLVGRFGSK